jgi:ATP-dependent DNA helicase DinG
VKTFAGIAQAQEPSYLDDTFKPGGLLALAKPGYTLRPQQLKLAQAVEQTFSGVPRKTLLAEAPTGVGKSFAYLVPAIHHAARDHRKVVVVTANIALQEQIVGRDLPFLTEVIPDEFTFALAKGWSNYACAEAFDATRNEQLKGRRLPVLQDQKQIEAVAEWLDHTETGDLSELPFEPTAEVRKRLTVSKEDCLGRACAFFDQCLPRAARKKLDAADIIVSNYHLFFADLAAKYSGGHGVLPVYDLVVLDEGHKAADIARDFFGERVTVFAIAKAVSLLDASGKRAEVLGIPRKLDPDLREQVITQADLLFAELTDLKANPKRYIARLDRAGMFDPSAVTSLLRQAASALVRAQAMGGVSPDGRLHLEHAAERCGTIASTLERAAGNIDGTEWIYYLDEQGKRSAVALMAVPFSMAEFLRPALFEKSIDPVAVVLTSATLTTSTGPGAFDFIASQLGCEAADELVVESPFDFSRACLVVPRLDPPSGDANGGWLNQMADAFVRSVELAGGRTLGLFTSFRALEAAYEALDRRRGPWHLLKHGEAPRTELLRRFRENEQSVLLGCESFWEGVDVPGPSCSLVFIDRIPFPHKLDPVADMMAAADAKSFMRYQVPLATIMLKQAVGRLIRAVDDRGVVVVGDVRLIEKPYGRHITRQLPSAMETFRTLGQAEPYLQHLKR